ncbi:hypothetical protein CYLTODRAFT_403692 [Cylindrobasidium torrendii FP15055 ss-10]|uniref:Uncharacterized protein n=1 Tax=Cylindrobasidium torrendii FP15055 ss-10 TaxID=1314674 RepID=A0A0D7AXK8_9AGAR|nr:hypothetical protein CYLTODRAFT_403692 [Cylindrobasidium torrendii FP15055 ss-10]
MYVPFITPRRTKNEKRKGGGGGGGGHGGGRGGSGRGGSTVGGKGSGGSSNVPSKSSWSNWGSTSSSKAGTPRPFANGVATTSTIPSGGLFAGRSVGGGTRANVYGSSIYGSGYPGVAGRGVAGRGFPFFFWPLSFGAVGGAGAASYLHQDEYGRPDNSSRPGGPQMTAAFQSNTTASIFRIVADNNTAVDLIDQIDASCSRYLTSSTADAVAYDAALLKPEQVVQYYRASSAALALDGFNNTAALSESEPEKNLNVVVPESVGIPVANTMVDIVLLACLNSTIGTTIDLADSASGMGIDASMPATVMLGWIVFWALNTLI